MRDSSGRHLPPNCMRGDLDSVDLAGLEGDRATRVSSPDESLFEPRPHATERPCHRAVGVIGAIGGTKTAGAPGSTSGTWPTTGPTGPHDGPAGPAGPPAAGVEQAIALLGTGVLGCPLVGAGPPEPPGSSGISDLGLGDRDLLRSVAEGAARAASRLAPTCVLHVHASSETLEKGKGVVRVEEIGPLTLAQARSWLTGEQSGVRSGDRPG